MIKEKRQEFDYSKLKGRIIEKCGSLSNFAEEFGASRSIVSLKINNKMMFTPDDIIKVSDLLEIDKTEIGVYFFTPRVKEV